MKKNIVKIEIFLCLWMILCLSGCGLKANPTPSTSAVPPGQSDKKMAVSINENAIVLTWNFLDPKGEFRYINIERSRLGSAGNTCRDCPRTFERIAQLTVRSDQNEYRFSDSSVEKGNAYSYRLKICSEIGVCRESQIVEIDYK